MTSTSNTLRRFVINNLEQAKRWYADSKPQHLPIKVCTNGVACLVLSKSGHVLRRD